MNPQASATGPAAASPAPGGWRRAVPWLLATAGYVVYTIVETWPLANRLTSVIPSDPGDPVLNTWILWWNAHAVPFTTRWWNAPAFWPSTGVLAYSEVLLGLTPLTDPIQWLGGSPMTAYNVTFLLTFPLSALAAHALVRRLTGRHDAGIVAGLIYGFHPFRIAHFPQIQVMTSYWMPLALLGAHAYLTSGRRRWLALFALSWLMQALSNGYYLLFFPVLAGVWMLWFGTAKWRTFAELTSAFLLGSLPLVPLLWMYRRVHAALNFQRDFGVVNEFGADVTALLDASPLLRFWHVQGFHRAEGELFPGVTAAVLVLLLVVGWLWKADPNRRPSPFVQTLLAASVLFIGVGLTSMLFGPWAIRIGRLTLLSVRYAGRPLRIGVILFAIAMALLPRVLAAWRRRSTLMFYTLAMALMYFLCFGPQPHFLGVPFMEHGPYWLLMAFPGYDAIRVPARFAMLAALCLSVVAAMTFARLTAIGGRAVRVVIAGIVIGGVLADTLLAEMPLETPPHRLKMLESLSVPGAVLELPLGNLYDDVAAMYRGMFHGRPVVNGYSGFFPTSYDMLSVGLANHDPQIFDALAAWGPIVVAVDTARDPDQAWTRQLERRPQTTVLGDEDGWKAFVLHGAATPPADLDSAQHLPIRGVSANVNQSRMALAVDGDARTRWDSGPQQGTEIVTIDLGAPRVVDGVTMTLGGRTTDSPRSLAIDTSEDEGQWTIRWDGSVGVAVFAAAVRDPRELPLTFPLPHVRTRWIRLRQLGRDPVFYWSIYELHVLGR